MLNALVSNYLSTAKGLPFFYAVSDDEYIATLNELKQSGLQVIKISDYCKKPDKFPSIESLVEDFRLGDVDHASNRFVLVGLGEYLALRGEAEALKVLRDLKSKTLGIARVVVLLRFVQRQLQAIVDEDIRIKAQRVLFQGYQSNSTSIVNIKTAGSLGLVNEAGIQSLLRQFEDGATGKVYVKSELGLDASLLPVTQITDSYSAIRQLVSGFSLPASLGDEDKWSRLLSDLQKCGNSLTNLMDKYGFLSDIDQDFTEKAFGLEYKNWLYYVALKLNLDKIKNPYLKLVISRVNDFTLLKKETITAIVGISYKSAEFKELYVARKKLLKGLPDSDIAMFIGENEIDPSESIYKFTDNTLIEKQAILRWVSEYGIIPEIKDIYPALASYLKKYVFDCGKISPLLTEYFDKYKLQKVQNKVYDDFAAGVTDNAMKYTSLDTRANALASISDKKSCHLYWIDALGVEYLSYIQDLAKEKGLSIHIDVVRADLPTITSINKCFYEEWTGSKEKESELDDIKHKEAGKFDYSKCKAPIHLANELEVIERAINIAVTKLAMHSCKKFIIASDHGASRLAVIAQREEKYETDTKGEHSGRCCKYFDGYDLSNAVSENGFVILTDYGRFKGSRAANVEVHGGASLEETVIPIITLSLKNQAEIDIRVLNPDNIVVERKKGISFTLYISDIESTNQVKIVMNGKSYIAECTDKTHYKVINPDIKRSGKYAADIFDGENLIGTVTINVKGAVGSANSGFDDLF